MSKHTGYGPGWEVQFYLRWSDSGPGYPSRPEMDEVYGPALTDLEEWYAEHPGVEPTEKALEADFEKHIDRILDRAVEEEREW